MTYANHLVLQFTGNEIVLYGMVIEVPLRFDPEEAIPDEVEAKVAARWAVPPQQFLDHLARTMSFVRRHPILSQIYPTVEANVASAEANRST